MTVYVGIGYSGEREVFKSATLPVQETHAHLFAAVMGPFKTMRGARFYAEYGRANPHIRHVNDAERIAKEMTV